MEKDLIYDHPDHSVRISFAPAGASIESLIVWNKLKLTVSQPSIIEVALGDYAKRLHMDAANYFSYQNKINLEKKVCQYYEATGGVWILTIGYKLKRPRIFDVQIKLIPKP